MEKQLDKREIQLHLVGMLDELVDYLEKHNLRYYLVGGTLLGAVRHQGFIPWDDDIDIGMPRPDYEKFLDLVKEESVGRYYKVISGREKTLSNPYCEMIDTRTRVEKASEEYIRDDCLVLNLFIDILPQDGWPSDDTEAEKLSKRMARDRYLIQNARARLGRGTSLGRMIAKTPIIILMRLIGYNRVIGKMDRIAKSYDYDSSEYVGAITFGIYGKGERCRHDETVNFEKVEFEGKKYNAPGGWDKYLTQIYGDYMTLPPEDKRVSHRMTVWEMN